MISEKEYQKKKLNKKIINKLLTSDETYKIIAKSFKISESKVKRVAKENNLGRYKKYDPVYMKALYGNIANAVNEGVSYDVIKEKYELNDSLLNYFNRNGFDNIRSKAFKLRNEILNKEYRNNTAKEVIGIKTPSHIVNPNEIKTVGGIYRCVKYRKYPKIGRRDLGGTFLDKKILRYILNKRDKHEWKYEKIANGLNKLGYRSSMNKEFSYYLVCYYYNSYKKKGKKKLTY